MALDITTMVQASVDSEWLNIKHPVTNDDTGGRVLIMNPDSGQYRNVAFERQNKQLAESRKGSAQITAEKIEESTLDLLVRVTIDWDGIEMNGAPQSFSSDNVRELYTALPWVREQVNTFIGERRNFFKA